MDLNIKNLEALASFMEENLTRLVKLKLLTREEFDEFDQLLSDYILADGLGDKERAQTLLEDTASCLNGIADHLAIMVKGDETVIRNPLVADYLLHIASTKEPDEDPFIEEEEEEEEEYEEEVEDTIDPFYHYEYPDYQALAKPGRLSKPITYLVPGYENNDINIDDDYEPICQTLLSWSRDKQISNITKLIYKHLAEWHKPDDEAEDTFMYGLRVAVALIERFHLNECVPLLLEILRQDLKFQRIFFKEDELDMMPAAALSSIIGTDELPMLLEFMKEQGILFDSKMQVALAVSHLPKHDAATLPHVQKWLSEVLSYYYPMADDTDIFNGELLDTLVFCCIHTNAVDLKQFIIKLYAKFKLPNLRVGGGCNTMRQQIKKAPLGTLDKDSAEQILTEYQDTLNDWDDDWDDEPLYDDEEEEFDEAGDEGFNLDDYEFQDFQPWTNVSKLAYKLIRNTQRYTLRISLDHTDPPIWRELEVPSSITLTSMAAIILVAMGWNEDHLHQFIAGKGKSAQFYATSLNEINAGLDSRSKDGRKFCIGELLRKLGENTSFEYDYGDGWCHTVKLTAISDYADGEAKEIKLLDGQRACPPEDCGGIPGYDNLCQAMKNPTSRHAQELIEWMGCRFDPELFPLSRAQRLIKSLSAAK